MEDVEKVNRRESEKERKIEPADWIRVGRRGRDETRQRVYKREMTFGSVERKGKEKETKWV